MGRTCLSRLLSVVYRKKETTDDDIPQTSMDLSSLGMSLEDVEFNDAELEAELKALSGAPAAKPKARPPPRQTSELTQAELADALRDKNYDDIDDMDLSGDEDLENELAALMGSDPPPPAPAPAPVPPKRAAPPPARPPLAKQPVSVGGIAGPQNEAPSRSQPAGPPPPLPARTSSVVSPTSPTTAAPTSPPPVAPPPALPTPAAAAPAEASPAPVAEDTSNLSEADKARHILKHRLEAYRKNLALAKEVGDAPHITEFQAIVDMFEQACQMAAENEVTMADLEGVPPTPKLYRKISTPTTLLEDLQQRYKMLLDLAAESQQKGEGARARRYERMANQFKDAVSSCQKGRVVAVAELPPVPGLKPLEEMPYAKNQKPAAGPAPRQPGAVKAAVDAIAAGGVPGPSATKLGHHQKSTAIEGDTQQQNELRFLLDRQEQFKIAAVRAKQAGDMNTAKEMLLTAKNLEPMIRSSEAGLPVDIRQVPVPPQAGVSAKLMRQVSVGADARLQEVEKSLLSQLTFCEQQGAAFRQLNDAKSSLLFDKLMKETKLDLLHFRQLLNSRTVPKVNISQVTLPTTNQPTTNGVAEDQLEIKVVGIEKLKVADGYKPHHLAIYVKVTFGYPRENPQTFKTTTISGTDNPEFGEVMVFNIDRKMKPLVRAIKSKPIKFEVFQKGSFLRSDKHWGTAEVSMAPLEKQAVITTSSEIIGERRARTGGRVTVQVRVARPITESDTGLANRRKAPTVQKQWIRIER